jgi:hypothetical protein
VFTVEWEALLLAVNSITSNLDELMCSSCRPVNVNLGFYVCVCWCKGISICNCLSFLHSIHGFSAEQMYNESIIVNTKLQFLCTSGQLKVLKEFDFV